MTKVTKFISRNLYGETRQQERSRLLKERIVAAREGKSRNISFGAGTTLEQRSSRRRALRSSNLSTKTPKYYDMYEVSRR